MSAGKLSTIETLLRSRLNHLAQTVREDKDLERALKSGEVDAIVVLQKSGAKLQRFVSDEPLYRTMVDELPHGAATVLTDGTIVYANRAMATMLTGANQELAGKDLLPYVAEPHRAMFSSMLKCSLNEPQELEITVSSITGEAPSLVSSIRLPISGVDAIGLAFVDLREQRARKAAEEASVAKDDLLAAVSHELRTPLASIMGWVQLLELDVGDDPRFKEAIHHLKNAVNAEVSLVDDLLDLSRASKGSLPITMRELDLREAVTTAASFVRLQAQNKSVQLELTLPETPLPVRGDSDRLRQVFVNLLSNGVKFTEPSGRVDVHVVHSNGVVDVRVSDSGMGINEEFLPYVFEPFRRGERSESYPGLGIGLAIARRLVEAHGGTISASSEGAGKGAEFTVRLPLHHD